MFLKLNAVWTPFADHIKGGIILNADNITNIRRTSSRGMNSVIHCVDGKSFYTPETMEQLAEKLGLLHQS